MVKSPCREVDPAVPPHADACEPVLQVSFYRGEVPSGLPEELARKRKGHAHQWLATLPLKLPVGDGLLSQP